MAHTKTINYLHQSSHRPTPYSPKKHQYYFSKISTDS